MSLFRVLRSKTTRQFWVAALLAGLSLTGADAKDMAREPEKPPGETIIVHGITPEVVRSEVEKILYAPWYHQLARWDSAFCPVVVGIPDPFRKVVLEHLTRTARAVIPGLPAQCSNTTVFVLFTGNGTAAFDKIVERDPSLGNGYGSIGINRDDVVPPHKEDIEALRKDRPVRWYRSTATDPAAAVTATSATSGKGGGRSVSINGPVDESYGGTSFELSKPTQVRTTSTILIVDLPLASGPTWGQLADYIAFAVLAGPKLGDDFSERSIMSLYDAGHFQKTAPSGLTSFDKAMLHALYQADPAQAASAEQGEIAQVMVRDLSQSTQSSP
jgi:hypothetical protein